MLRSETRKSVRAAEAVSCPACGRRLRPRDVTLGLAGVGATVGVLACPSCRTRFPAPPTLPASGLGRRRRPPTPVTGLRGTIQSLTAVLAELWKICREPPKRSRKARRWGPFRLDGAIGFAAYPVAGGPAGSAKVRNGTAAHDLFRQRRGRVL